jgi:hypothetical protein
MPPNLDSNGSGLISPNNISGVYFNFFLLPFIII